MDGVGDAVVYGIISLESFGRPKDQFVRANSINPIYDKQFRKIYRLSRPLTDIAQEYLPPHKKEIQDARTKIKHDRHLQQQFVDDDVKVFPESDSIRPLIGEELAKKLYTTLEINLLKLMKIGNSKREISTIERFCSTSLVEGRPTTIISECDVILHALAFLVQKIITTCSHMQHVLSLRSCARVNPVVFIFSFHPKRIESICHIARFLIKDIPFLEGCVFQLKNGFVNQTRKASRAQIVVGLPNETVNFVKTFMEDSCLRARLQYVLIDHSEILPDVDQQRFLLSVEQAMIYLENLAFVEPDSVVPLVLNGGYKINEDTSSLLKSLCRRRDMTFIVDPPIKSFSLKVVYRIIYEKPPFKYIRKEICQALKIAEENISRRRNGTGVGVSSRYKVLLISSDAAISRFIVAYFSQRRSYGNRKIADIMLEGGSIHSLEMCNVLWRMGRTDFVVSDYESLSNLDPGFVDFCFVVSLPESIDDMRMIFKMLAKKSNGLMTPIVYITINGSDDDIEALVRVLVENSCPISRELYDLWKNRRS